MTGWERLAGLTDARAIVIQFAREHPEHQTLLFELDDRIEAKRDELERDEKTGRPEASPGGESGNAAVAAEVDRQRPWAQGFPRHDCPDPDMCRCDERDQSEEKYWSDRCQCGDEGCALVGVDPDGNAHGGPGRYSNAA